MKFLSNFFNLFKRKKPSIICLRCNIPIFYDTYDYLPNYLPIAICSNCESKYFVSRNASCVVGFVFKHSIDNKIFYLQLFYNRTADLQFFLIVDIINVITKKNIIGAFKFENNEALNLITTPVDHLCQRLNKMIGFI